MLITWLFQRGFAADSRIQNLNVMPVGAWLFDLLENLGIVTMLSIYPRQPTSLAWVTAVFTFVKWMFAGVSIVLLLVGLIKAALNGFKKR